MVLSTPAEKPALFTVLASQQNRGKRRRQGQRIKRGNGNRKRDGQCELAEKNSRGSREERHRQNTATSTSEVAITAPATSFMATEAALCVSRFPLACGVRYSQSPRWRRPPPSPVARVMPNSVSVLIENPSSLTNAKVPINETGMVTAGIRVLRQSSRKRKITRITRTMASRRDQTRPGWIRRRRRWYQKHARYHAGRKASWTSRANSAIASAVHFKGVRVGELGDGNANGLMAVERDAEL